MANKKITELTELTSPAGADLFAIVDDTDTTTKKVTVTNLMTLAPQGDLEAANNLSDLNDAATARTNLGLGTAATSASTDFSPAFFNIVSETTTARTLSDSDNGKVIVCSNSSSVTITVPSGLTSGFNCKFVQSGTGKVSLVGSGATVQAYNPSGADPYNSTAGQYASIKLIPTGSNAYVVFGEVGPGPFANAWAVSLDGTNDIISCGNVTTINSATNLTTSVWFNADSIASQPVLVSGEGSSSNNYWIQIFNSTSVRYHNNGNTDTITIPTLSTGTWYNFTAVQSGTSLSFYVDGSLQGTATVSAVGSGWGTSYTIGRWSAGPYNYFDGYVDEIALWTSALDSTNVSEIASSAPIDLSTNSLNGNYDQSSSLVNWWRMGDNNNGTGTTVTDNAGSNDGVLLNGAAFSSTTTP